jgi:hypothetical protein
MYRMKRSIVVSRSSRSWFLFANFIFSLTLFVLRFITTKSALTFSAIFKTILKQKRMQDISVGPLHTLFKQFLYNFKVNLRFFMFPFLFHKVIKKKKLIGLIVCWDLVTSVDWLFFSLCQFPAFLMEYKEGDSDQPLSIYLSKIPAAIAAAQQFQCQTCSHRFDSPWPPLHVRHIPTTHTH